MQTSKDIIEELRAHYTTHQPGKSLNNSELIYCITGPQKSTEPPVNLVEGLQHLLTTDPDLTNAEFLVTYLCHINTKGHILFQALQGNNPAIVRALLEHLSGHGQNPAEIFISDLKLNLLQAATHVKGIKPEILDDLIKHGVPINYKTHDGHTPLSEAYKKSNFGAMEFLLKNGADINHKYHAHNSILSDCLLSASDHIQGLSWGDHIHKKLTTSSPIQALNKLVEAVTHFLPYGKGYSNNKGIPHLTTAPTYGSMGVCIDPLEKFGKLIAGVKLDLKRLAVFAQHESESTDQDGAALFSQALRSSIEDITAELNTIDASVGKSRSKFEYSTYNDYTHQLNDHFVSEAGHVITVDASEM